MKRRKSQQGERLVPQMQTFLAETVVAVSEAATRISRARRRMSKALRQVGDQLDALARSLDEVSEGLRGVTEDMVATGATLGLSWSPVLVLGLDDRERLTLNGTPLEIESFDEKRRWLSLSNLGGRLLIDLARGAALDRWDADDLAKAIQQIKRASAIGRERVLGRGRDVRLSMKMELDPVLAARAGTAATAPPGTAVGNRRVSALCKGKGKGPCPWGGMARPGNYGFCGRCRAVSGARGHST